MQLDGFIVRKDRHKCLDTQSVKSGRTIQQDRIIFHHIFQNAPDFRLLSFDEFLGILYLIHFAHLLQSFDEVGLEQLDCHIFGQTALIEFQFRTHGDHRTAGIIHSFSQQVLAESALLTLQLIGEGFERTVASATHGAGFTAVVDQSVHRFLQHAFFIAQDHLGCADFEQTLEAVVAGDHAAIEIVKICRGKSAAFQWNQRPQGRRQYR